MKLTMQEWSISPMSGIREPSRMSPKNFCLEKALHVENVGQVLRSLNPKTRDVGASIGTSFSGTLCYHHVTFSKIPEGIVFPTIPQPILNLANPKP